MQRTDRPFVSRGGLKLQAALEAFGLHPTGRVCADFGANVGGFTDCLLRHGAARVYAVDTGYGELAWNLRRDGRVVVMERTNALYVAPPEAVDLVVVDVAFTPQRLILPAARRWLGRGGQIVSLLKPHYELSKQRLGAQPPRPGRLSRAQAVEVCDRTCRELEALGLAPRAVMPSPLRGKGGNPEFFLHIRPQA